MLNHLISGTLPRILFTPLGGAPTALDLVTSASLQATRDTRIWWQADDTGTLRPVRQDDLRQSLRLAVTVRAWSALATAAFFPTAPPLGTGTADVWFDDRHLQGPARLTPGEETLAWRPGAWLDLPLILTFLSPLPSFLPPEP